MKIHKPSTCIDLQIGLCVISVQIRNFWFPLHCKHEWKKKADNDRYSRHHVMEQKG